MHVVTSLPEGGIFYPSVAVQTRLTVLFGFGSAEEPAKDFMLTGLGAFIYEIFILHDWRFPLCACTHRGQKKALDSLVVRITENC